MAFSNTPIMGDTTIPDSLVIKYWAKEVWEAGINESYFSRFMGRSSDSIIHIKTELQKGPGDTINIPLRLPLNGAGIINDNWLEGNEEKLTYRDFNVPLAMIRHAVRLEGRFEEKKTQINMRRDAKAALKDWLAKYIDCSCFAMLTGTTPPFIKSATDVFPFTIEAPSPDRIMYAGSATSENTITPADSFNTTMIGKAKRMAIENEDTAIRPIRVDGHDTYVIIIDHYMARDLKADPIWHEAQQFANVRGMKNPIFTGALGYFDGVVVHENGRVPRTATGSSGAMVGHAMLLGAQALVMAEGEAPRSVTKTFDYNNKYGTSISRMFGMKKARFQYDGVNWSDYGVINILASSAADT